MSISGGERDGARLSCLDLDCAFGGIALELGEVCLDLVASRRQRFLTDLGAAPHNLTINIDFACFINQTNSDIAHLSIITGALCRAVVVTPNVKRVALLTRL